MKGVQRVVCSVTPHAMNAARNERNTLRTGC